MRTNKNRLNYLDEGFKALIKGVLKNGGSVRVIPDTAYTELQISFPASLQPQVLRLRGSYKEVEKELEKLKI
jgi:hypothetical protein